MSRSLALLFERVHADALAAALADRDRWICGPPATVLAVHDDDPPSPAIPLGGPHGDVAARTTAWLAEAAQTPSADGTRLCDLTYTVTPAGGQPLPFHLWWSLDSYLQPRVSEALALARRLRAALEAEAPETVYVGAPRTGDAWSHEMAMDVLQRWQAGGRPLRVEPVTMPQAPPVLDAGPFDPTTTPRGVAIFERHMGRGCEETRLDNGIRITSASDLCVYQGHVAAGTSMLEVALQRVAGEPGAVGFELDDGQQRQSVRVDADSLSFGTGERVDFDPRDLHVYRLHIQGRQALLEVDGKPVLAGRTVRGSQPECLWGHLGGEGHAVSAWHRVRWGRTPTQARPSPPWAWPWRRVQPAAAPAAATLPRARSHALVGWSGTRRAFERARASVLPDIAAALQKAGLPCTRVSVGAPQDGEPYGLSSWQGDLPVSRQRIEHDLRAAWRGWRREAPPLPECDDVTLDGLVSRRVDDVMAKVAQHVCEAWAFDQFCRRFHPASLVSDRVLGFDRHLAEVAARHRIPTLAVVGELGLAPESLYGLRLPNTTHPPLACLLVPAEAQREEALRGGTLPCAVELSGTPDLSGVFNLHGAASPDGEVRRLGFAPAVERLLLLDIGSAESALPRRAGRRVAEAMLAAIVDRPDLGVVVQAPDDVDHTWVRALVEAGGGRVRAWRGAPPAWPLLQHAAAVVGPPSPTLAAYAIMGRRPIMLALSEALVEPAPATIFRPFCSTFDAVETFCERFPETLARLEAAAEPLDAKARRSVVRVAGLPDGSFDTRVAEVVARFAGTSQGAPGPLRLDLSSPFLSMGAEAPASRRLAVLTDEASYVTHAFESMRAFRAEYPNAPIVTFDHATKDEVTAQGATFWRDLLLPAQHYDLVGRSNARLDALIERLSPLARDFILPYYHECASILVSAVFATELAQENPSLYIVWPGLNADLQAFENLGMRVTAYGRIDRTRELSFGQVQSSWMRTAAQIRQSDEGRRALDRTRGKELALDGDMLVWSPGRRPDAEDARARVLIALDASGSSSNIRAARAVVEELTRRGVEVLMLGPTDAVVRQCREFCATSWRPPHAIDSDTTERSLHLAGAVAAELEEALHDYAPGSAEWILVHTVIYRLPGYISGKLVAEATLDEMHAAYPFDAVLTYADSNLISHWTGTWARAQGLTWHACLQILISKHPDTSWFPADVHLVYGEQCAEVVRGSGARSEIVSVGSTLFDAGVGRALEDDVAIVRGLVPAWGDRKLVVVGTEHRPNEDVEIVPILRQLSAMPDVHVVLKLHPDDSEAFFRGLVEQVPHRDNITLLTRCDLFALLHAADLLICMRSNIIVNAAMFGTPTLICDFSAESPEENWSNFTIDFEKEGLGVGCYQAEGVSEAVRRQLFDEDVRRATVERLLSHLRRFNAAADGRTDQRIADYLLERVRR